MRTARYLDPEHTVFEVVDDDGKQWVGPADVSSQLYRELTEGDLDADIEPVPIADYVAPPLTDDDVDVEVDRRARKALLDAERKKLQPAAEDLKRRIKAGENVDLADDAEWAAKPKSP